MKYLQEDPSNPSAQPKCTAFDALEQEVLHGLPNDLARVCYLASLYDQTTGEYRDFGRASRFGTEASHSAIKRAHEDVFARLLQVPLEELAAQFRAWIESEPEKAASILKEWSEEKTYLRLMPVKAPDSDRLVFEGNLTAVLQLTAARWRSKLKGR